MYAFRRGVTSTNEEERGEGPEEPARRAPRIHQCRGGVPPQDIAVLGKLIKQKSVQIRRTALASAVARKPCWVDDA